MKKHLCLPGLSLVAPDREESPAMLETGFDPGLGKITKENGYPLQIFLPWAEELAGTYSPAGA